MDSKEQKEIIYYCRSMFGCFSVDFGKYVRGLITGKIERDIAANKCSEIYGQIRYFVV